MAGIARSARVSKRQARSADGALAESQAILFVDDKTVSKGMVKYATNLPRESIVDVSGEVHVPDAPVAGCTCSKVRLPPLLRHSPHCATLFTLLLSSRAFLLARRSLEASCKHLVAPWHPSFVLCPFEQSISRCTTCCSTLQKRLTQICADLLPFQGDALQ